MRSTIGTFALLCAVAPFVAADDKKSPALGWNDFLPLAIDDAMACQRFSDLADKRAGSDKVKAFAKKLSTECDASWKQLSKAAEGKRVVIITGLQKGSQATLLRLTSLSGEKFDKDYMYTITNKLATMEKMVAGQKDSDVESISQYVKDRHKGLKELLEEGQKLQKTVGDPEKKDK